MLGRHCTTEPCLTSPVRFLWDSFHKPCAATSLASTSRESNLSTGLTSLERSNLLCGKAKWEVAQQLHMSFSRLDLNLLYSSGWPQTSGPLVSSPWKLGLQACTTVTDSIQYWGLSPGHHVWYVSSLPIELLLQALIGVPEGDEIHVFHRGHWEWRTWFTTASGGWCLGKNSLS